ncbi:MAG: fasciclin domain-containing protein [Myxococcota bacterium]
MSLPAPHDTLRRVATSVAILGCAFVLFDGGRGLTGRAGGGQVGCGGSVPIEADSTGRHQGLGLRPVHARPSVQLVPVLELERGSLLYRPAKSPGGTNSSPTIAAAPVALNPPPARPAPALLDLIQDRSPRFADLIKRTGLDFVLEIPNRRFTVFVPLEEAIDQLQKDHPDIFEAKNASLLQDLVAHHIVTEEIAAISPRPVQTLLAGSTLELRSENGEQVSTPEKEIANIETPLKQVGVNGMVYVIDRALVPHFTVWSHLRNSGFSFFVTAIEATKQVERFADPDATWTVLAPSDETFRLFGWDANRLNEPGFRQDVRDIVDAHVIGERLDVAKLQLTVFQTADRALIKTYDANGQIIVERESGDGLGEIVVPNVSADEGYIHGLDAFLYDPQ